MGAEETAQSKKTWKGFKIAACVLLLVLVGFGAGLWLTRISDTDIPKEIRSQLSFPIHLPDKLPDHFAIDQSSFAVNEGTLVFSATNGLGSHITFTEQRKPADMNFDAFYSEQLQDSQLITDTPFPAVTGKNKFTNFPIVSIVTDETWILITSSSPLGESLLDIARHIKRVR